MRYVPRAAAKRLRRLLSEFPAVLVHGPRQSGKSTLVREECPAFRALDLERPADFDLLSADLEGYLAANPRRLAVDEAQRLPALFPALRHAIDAGRGFGRFVLTGSASPALMRGVTESLAGRIALVELTPFRSAELEPARAETRWFWGGFPDSRSPSSRKLVS
jgi:predicted AAA+ superfamily ATPase